ncbi:TPA: hypothetical protein ACPVXB_005070 [Vibrio parahaemolyticus]
MNQITNPRTLVVFEGLDEKTNHERLIKKACTLISADEFDWCCSDIKNHIKDFLNNTSIGEKKLSAVYDDLDPTITRKEKHKMMEDLDLLLTDLHLEQSTLAENYYKAMCDCAVNSVKAGKPNPPKLIKQGKYGFKEHPTATMSYEDLCKCIDRRAAHAERNKPKGILDTNPPKFIDGLVHLAAQRNGFKRKSSL